MMYLNEIYRKYAHLRSELRKSTDVLRFQRHAPL